jgi:hypothetical protein
METGARAGSTLLGTGSSNRGLRVRIMQDQPRGHGGPILGRFEILDPGDNKHADVLRDLLGATTDAESLLRLLRRGYPQCVNVANANILAIETDPKTH